MPISPTQNIVATVIPAGKAGTAGNLRRFSVHIAPRLAGAEYLVSFDDFVNWAEAAKKELGVVRLRRLGIAPGYTQIGASVVATRISAEPDPELWSALFFSPDSLPVDDFEPAGAPNSFGTRFKSSTYRSYPVVPIHDHHTKIIGDLAISYESTPPPLSFLRTAFGELRSAVSPRERPKLEQTIDGAFSRGDNVAWTRVLRHGPDRPGSNAAEKVTADHLQLMRFLQPRTDIDYITKTKPEVEQPRLDFHRILATLADHPYIMRLLGLVMDYEIDAGQVAEAGQFLTTSFVQLDSSSWTWATGASPVARTVSFPRTALNGKDFLARVRTPAQMGPTGIAKLDGGYSSKTGRGWAITTLDVEGTAVKSLALADQLNRVGEMSATDSPAALNVPAPRSGGLSLIRAGRSLDVVEAFKRSTELLEGTAAGATASPSAEVGTLAGGTSGDGVELYAEDLIRGWRVDVFDTTTGRWQSLMKRDSRYEFSVSKYLPSDVAPPQKVYDIADGTRMDPPTTGRPMFLNEGVVQLGVTTSANPLYANDDTFVGEALLEWTGWSLVAPRPGRTLSARTNEPVERVRPYNADLDLAIDVVATPGSLPRLRFGRTYRFRMRSANLAGNGPTLEEVGVTGSASGTPSPPAVYSRFEPIPAPVVVPKAPFGVGESLAELVIRSDDEFDPSTTPGESVRHLLAPAASAHLVELHGMLDVLSKPDAYGLLSMREGLKLETSPPVWQVMMPYYDYMQGAATKDPNSGDDGTLYVGGEIPLPPWLVDPAAAGIVMSGPEMGTKATAYVPAPLVPMPSPTPWADPMSSRLTLRGLDVDKPAKLSLVSPTSTDTWKTRRFLVEIAKGEQFTVQVASSSTTAFAKQLGIYQLLQSRAPAGLPARLGRISKGQNRLTSPSMVLRVVHAVRRPLLEPKILIATPTVVRRVGLTYADFGGRMTCHPQSTSQVDWNLSWSEWADRPGDAVGSPSSDRPRIISGSGSTQPQRVEYPKPGVRPKIFSASGLRHEFGDTKHRYVKVSLTATSRYARYFTEREHRVISSATVNFSSGGVGVQPFSERIINETTGQTLQRDVDYKINYPLHEFTLTPLGQSKHLPPSGPDYSFYIEWVPANVTRSTLPVNERMVHVRSSARPAAPVVNDVFPLFVDSPWTTLRVKSIPIGEERVRNGHALRVYLDRPWYSSGDDEMLAVILHRTGGLKKLAGMGVAPLGAGQTGIPKSRTQRYTTAWGRDPRVLGSAASSVITSAAFPRAADAPLFGKFVSGLPVPGAETAVVAVPHAVEYDEAQGLWFSDIQIELGNAYRPFVRLALARFQPYSLDGCHFSDVVLLDTAQLGPRRTLSVVGLFGGKKTVTLSGPMYSGGLTGIPKLPTSEPFEFVRPPMIEVSVQFRPISYVTGDPATDADLANIGWQDVVDDTTTRRYLMKPIAGSVPNGIGKYAASEVNVAPPDEGLQMRLLVKEYERDSRTSAEIIEAGDDPLGGFRRRVVWMDSFDLL